MRASHSSKTYQLGPARTANSACFRDFLTKITGFSGIFGGIAPTADALAGPAAFPLALCHVVCGAERCSDGGGLGGCRPGVRVWCGGVWKFTVTGVVVKVGEPPNLVVGGLSTCNDVPAVTYSPTPSRVQYHRRCGS